MPEMIGPAAKAITVAAFSMVLYTYAGYPLLLAVMSILAGKKGGKKETAPGLQELPSVSIIITAYNEEKAIGEKIDATLDLDYPEDKLEIIVASDGSTDKTEEIVRSFSSRKVRLVSVTGRKGKTAAQNAAVLHAAGEILVFSDATGVYHRNAIRELVRPFEDPEVGCAGGRVEYLVEGESASSRGGGAYWGYERWIKEKESEIGSLIGVSGAIYAVRKSIYAPVPPDQISDFVIALQTVESGYRVAYADRAVCSENTMRQAGNEFAMRVRVALRSLRALWCKKGILNPFRHGFYSFQLISHKVLRYLVPQMLLILLVFNLLILDSGVFRYLFFLQVLFYSLAVAGKILDRMGASWRPASLAYYFCLLNVAVLWAFFKFLKGEKMVTWEPIRHRHA